MLEATLFWAWLEAQLTAAGYTVVVAHPYQVKLIWQARTKTDPIDARKLAELARVHLLPAIWIPDGATRAERQLLRGRAFLVRQRTVLKNRIHAYLTAENLHCPALDPYSKAGRAWLGAYPSVATAMDCRSPAPSYAEMPSKEPMLRLRLARPPRRTVPNVAGRPCEKLAQTVELENIHRARAV